MKFQAVISGSVIGGIVGIVVSFLILPALVTNLADTLDSLDIVGVSGLIGWIGEIMIMVTLGITSGVLTRFFKAKVMIIAFITSLVFGILLLCIISFWWVSFLLPELFVGYTIGEKLAKWYLYPSILSIAYGSPQLVWIMSTVIHIVLYNVKFYQMAYQGKTVL